MIDQARARGLAMEVLGNRTLGEARETTEGWFFPYATPEIGSNGVIVNKRTGRVFQLGSAFPIERDIAMYDRGYQFERYDLVVLTVHDVKRSRQTISRLGLQVVEPVYENGQVWRIPKSMTDTEVWSRLEKLPCIFPAASLYFRLEILEEARSEGWLEFEALEYRPVQWLDA